MGNTNTRRKELLGMAYGTARARLQKTIMFKLIQEAGFDICFRCGKKIKNIGELSVEHKISWMNSKDPVGLFFDLNNIAFSHLVCNTREKVVQHGSAKMYERYGCRCKECTNKQRIKKAEYRARLPRVAQLEEQ